MKKVILLLTIFLITSYSTAALANQGVAIQRVITYLLMATYCAEEYGERVNMKRVRELRNTIQNKLPSSQIETTNFNKQKRKKRKGKQLNAGI